MSRRTPPPVPPEPSLFDPPDLPDLSEAAAGTPVPQAADGRPAGRRRQGPARPAKAGRTPERPPRPAAAARPAASPASTEAAGARRRKRLWRSGLETDIKTEALSRFQKGEDVEAVARALMLPKSAVRTWHEEYERGILLASERTLEKAGEPTLF